MSPSSRSPTLLDQVRDALRRKHSSLRTDKASIGWVRRFVRFCSLQHSHKTGVREIGAFLSRVAVDDEERDVRLDRFSSGHG